MKAGRSLVFAIGVIGGICFLVTLATAQETGRYQMVQMDKSSVTVIDTKEGHLWGLVVSAGNSGIIYLGQVKPGEKMGEVIDTIHIPKDHKKGDQ